MKNELFNKYLEKQITIEELVLFFDEYNKQYKSSGKVYTPKYISDYIVSILNPTLEEIILEPSVGHGIFIFSLLEFIEKKYSLSSLELKEYFLNKVYAIDISQTNIIELNQLIKLFFKKRNEYIIIEDNLIIGNTFKVKHLLPKKIDVIFGNPPYVRVKNISDNDLFYLKENYTSCSKGNIDLYYAFVEFSILNSSRASFITPNSWLYNSSAKILRKLIKPYLISVIDFKDKMIFSNADTYTSIFFFDKNIKKEKIIYKEDLNEYELEINKRELNDNRWSFGKSLKKEIPILNYHTPIATLLDKAFINTGLKKDCIPFYKLSKIKSKEDFLSKQQTILFPYTYPYYVLKEEEDFDNETFNYLLTQKEKLLNRDKGKADKYLKWYAYGRKQGLNKFKNDTSFIIIPGMINLDYKFFSVPSKLIKKPFLFSSGFILEVDSKYKVSLINFFNSEEFKDYLKFNGKVWKGKNPYYSINMTQLKEIFI